MLCHGIATARNRKIRNEAIYRSLLRTFHPIFINIQATYRISIEPILDVTSGKQDFRNEPRLSDAKSQFGSYFHTDKARLHAISTT